MATRKRLALALMLPGRGDPPAPAAAESAGELPSCCATGGGYRWFVTSDPDDDAGADAVTSANTHGPCVWRAVPREAARGVPGVHDPRPFYTLSSLGMHADEPEDVLARELRRSLEMGFAERDAAGVVVSLPLLPALMPALLAAGFRVLGEERPGRASGSRPVIRARWPVSEVLGERLPPALILGRPNPNMLAQVRALGRSGVPVHCLIDRGEPAVIARVSRYAVSVVDVRRMPDVELIAHVGRLAESAAGKPILFFGGDYDVSLAARLWEGLTDKVRAVSHPPAANRLQDKQEQCGRVAQAGVRVPRGAVIRSVDGLGELLPTLQMPVICRPVELSAQGTFTGKIFIASDSATLERRLSSAFDDPRTRLLVQEYVPGGDDSLLFVLAVCEQGGRVRVTVCGRKLFQYPEGLMCCGETVEDPELTVLANRSLQALGVTGIVGVEFKRHAETGALFYIESNTRPDNFIAIAETAGINLCLLAYLQTAGFDAMIAMRPRPAHWHDASMEMLGRLTGNLPRGALGTIHHSRRGAAVCDAIMAADDPLPAFAWHLVKAYRLSVQLAAQLLRRLTVRKAARRAARPDASR